MFAVGARFDWKTIAQHYAAGYTRADCQAKFGFSNGAWNRAVERGDVVPGARSSGVRASEKPRRIGELRDQGHTYSEIAEQLGLTKPTVAYHVRRLGIAPDAKAARRYDWEAIQRAYDSGLSVRGCASRFGFCHASWAAAVRRGAIIPRPQACRWPTCWLSAGHRRAVGT